MKKSAEFEQLVAKIVGELEPTAVVTWDDHIVGKLSGRKRQIDVSIRRKDPDFLGIIDAKDYKRPATIDRVDALSSVVREVEAQYGALVCSGGFSNSIHQYARNCGISLLNVHDAQSANWSLELKIPILWHELTPEVQMVGEFNFEPGDLLAMDEQHGPQVTTDGGNTTLQPFETFRSMWNQGTLPSVEPGSKRYVFSNQSVEAGVRDASGARQLRPVTRYGFAYIVHSSTWLGKFQPEECRGLVDYLNDQAFTASYLPESALPMKRDKDWEQVEDVGKLAITATQTVVVGTAAVLLDGAITLTEGTMVQLEPHWSETPDPVPRKVGPPSTWIQGSDL